MSRRYRTYLTRIGLACYNKYEKMFPYIIKGDILMNEVIRALHERRSPSGMNRQAAVMVAVEDRATRDKLAAMNAAVMGRDGDPFYDAPTVIVVLADRARSHTALEDGCLVMQNLMLAAHSLGVGSCWIHRAREVFDTEEGRVLLKKWGLEGDYVGIGNCILGYPADPIPGARERLEARIVRVRENDA